MLGKLIRSDLLAKFSFDIGGNLNQTVHCNSKSVWNLEPGITLV